MLTKRRNKIGGHNFFLRLVNLTTIDHHMSLCIYVYFSLSPAKNDFSALILKPAALVSLEQLPLCSDGLQIAVTND